MERSSGAPSSPVPAEPVPAGELAFAALGRHRERLLANEAGTRLGENPEALHDMRVATRRLRAGLALFAEVLPKRGERLRRELGWLGRTLGEVRDLDVQIERLATEAGQDAALAPAAAAVAAVLAKHRDGARRRMLRALDSRRYARLLDALAAYVAANPGARRRGLARQPAALLAPDLLARAYKKVRRTGERLTDESKAEEFHRMRIRTKRLRYAIEFHESLYGKPADELVARLVAIQDHLGVHQDCHVMLAQIDELRLERAKRLPPGALFAMGTLAERLARRGATLRRQFPRLFRAVRGKTWKRLKHAFDARVADAVRPRRQPRARVRKAQPEPARQPEPTGDASWTPTQPAPSRSTPQPPTSTAS